MLYHILAYYITIHHHTVNLQKQAQTTREQAFQITAGQKVDNETWLLHGRAWLDISLDDILFAIKGDTFQAYRITQIVTYNHGVETLSRMMTGSI